MTQEIQNKYGTRIKLPLHIRAVSPALSMLRFLLKGILFCAVLSLETFDFCALAEPLGVMSSNEFLPDSTSNPFSPYNNPFNPNSPRNLFGPYGNPFSPYSANNPFATQGPIIYGRAQSDESQFGEDSLSSNSYETNGEE